VILILYPSVGTSSHWLSFFQVQCSVRLLSLRQKRMHMESSSPASSAFQLSFLQLRLFITSSLEQQIRWWTPLKSKQTLQCSIKRQLQAPQPHNPSGLVLISQIAIFDTRFLVAVFKPLKYQFNYPIAAMH
jgi:hypothetical protein